jgi:hypothetical protein
MLGGAIALLAIPAEGCFHAGCSEGCEGYVECKRYSPEVCESHQGCELGGTCFCALHNCDARLIRDCSSRLTGPACGELTGCAWQGACVGTQNCHSLYSDEQSCETKSRGDCNWGRNCG